jgi:hypothetical protein
MMGLALMCLRASGRKEVDIKRNATVLPRDAAFLLCPDALPGTSAAYYKLIDSLIASEAEPKYRLLPGPKPTDPDYCPKCTPVHGYCKCDPCSEN